MISQVANRYTILSILGQGGMADVYKATDMILNREVAIKVLRSKLSDDPMILVRFQREASAASRLSHPNVVDIYDVGEFEGMHYIVMEYVKGPTLKQLIARRGALDVSEAVFIMKQLTSAIANAHQHNIIHRDIKPQNVLVKDDGTVKITDFGIAVAADNVQLTFNNAVMGSAHYLAPESAQGKEPDVRVDVYSLGIVFYELLTGQLPFRGKTPTEIAIKHMREPMPYVRDFNRQIPQSVENIVLKATAKDPDQRYSSAAAMLADLQKCLMPQYQNVERLHLEPVTIPVVKVSQGHIEVVDHEKNNGGSQGKKKKRKKINGLYFTIGAAIGAGIAMAAFLVCLFAGIIRFDGVLGYEKVPSVAGLSESAALEAVKDAGFTDVTVKNEVNDTYDKGQAVGTSEAAGSIVKGSDPLQLYVSKGPSFLVGDYTGRYLDSVQQEMQDNGIVLNYEIEYQGTANTKPGIILEQSTLKPGERIDPSANETITFTVSAYPSITVDSSLIGMDLDTAKNMLNEQGIAVVLRPLYGGYGTQVIDVYPPVGSTYTQDGTDSVLVLYYE